MSITHDIDPTSIVPDPIEDDTDTPALDSPVLAELPPGEEEPI